MSIFEKKQELFSRGVKPEKMPLLKQEKKDTPAFVGKSFLKRIKEKKPEKKEPSSIIQKKEIKTKDIRWGILSRKNELYTKYNILGKEADEFAKEIVDKKYGSFLDIRESSKLKGDLEKTQRTASDIKARIRAGNKLRFLKDKYGI
ncbi:hypothetical protein KAU40_01985 [Candidatus Parcubacteria bacterium]|nr:hypothetical protein [Candidatus Parcubacteria bacterium]